MKTILDLTEKAAIGAEMIRSGEGNKKCEVCGGRVVCCFHFGHRPEKDKHILWHPDDMKGIT